MSTEGNRWDSQKLRDQLSRFLRQNDLEYHQHLNEADPHAGFVLENLDKLPTKEWGPRLEQAARLYPHCKVVDCDSRLVNDSGLCSEVLYSVRAEGLPTLQVRVRSRNEVLESVWVEPLAALRLSSVCPSFAQALESNYVPRCKIDLIMFGFHALALRVAERTAAFAHILQEHAVPAEPRGPATYIEVPVGGRTVQLHWELHLEDTVVGDIVARVSVAVLRGDAGVPVEGANTAFQQLLKSCSVREAFATIVKNAA